VLQPKGIIMSDMTGMVLMSVGTKSNFDILNAKIIDDPVIIPSLPLHKRIKETIDTDFSDFSSDDILHGEISLDMESVPTKQIREWIDHCNDLLSERDKKLIKKNQQRTNCMRRGLILSLSIHTYNLSLTDDRDKWKNIFKAFESKLYRTKRKCFSKVVSSFYSKHPDIRTQGFPHAEACQQFPWWDHRFINKEIKETT